MNKTTRKIALFGLLTALALILGFFDRQIPLFGGMIPGFKLGLANTVLIYAVYMMDWKSCVLLMLTKVLLTGFLFGNMQSIWVSLAGGALSLLVMLLVKRKPERGMIAVSVVSAASAIWIPVMFPKISGEILWILILTCAAFAASTIACIAIRRGLIRKVIGTSLCGAVAHNLGQTLIAVFVFLQTPRLMITYFPFLVGVGALVGCLTGIVAERVMKLLKAKPADEIKETAP